MNVAIYNKNDRYSGSRLSIGDVAAVKDVLMQLGEVIEDELGKITVYIDPLRKPTKAHHNEEHANH